MTKSPKVIFNSIFTLALNNPDSKYKNHSKSIIKNFLFVDIKKL